MNTELKATIKDLYQVEKNPETILTVLKDEGHKLTIDQVNEVLGVKKPTAPKNTLKKEDGAMVEVIGESIAKGKILSKVAKSYAPKEILKDAPIAKFDVMKITTDIDKAIQEAADAIQEAQNKVTDIWELKKKAGHEAGRYVRSAHQLRKLKKTIEG